MGRTGRCLCGQVSYILGASPLLTAVCHCRNCQRQSGSAFSIIVLAKTATVEIDGNLRTFLDKAENGASIERRFCPDCGSAMFSWQSSAPDRLIIKAGTLDDPSGLRPSVHVWCASAQPWVAIPENVVRFPGNPPSG